MNFLPMALSKLPKSFGFENIEKGFFPYFSLSRDTMNFVGKTPAIEFFWVQAMKSEKREEFLVWYETQKNIEFDMMGSLLKYTRDDVQIHRLAMMKFRHLILAVTTQDGSAGIDPFKYVTLASLVMAIYKKLFLREIVEVTLVDGCIKQAEKQNDKIYIENHDPLPINDPLIKKVDFKKSPIAACNPKMLSKSLAYSDYSILWLKYEAHKRGIFIQHALNLGEKKVRALTNRMYSLDGYHRDEITGEQWALEYQGCLVHGCPTCFPDPNVKHLFFKTTMVERKMATDKKVSYLESLGFKVIQMWEHTFNEL